MKNVVTFTLKANESSRHSKRGLHISPSGLQRGRSEPSTGFKLSSIPFVRLGVAVTYWQHSSLPRKKSAIYYNALVAVLHFPIGKGKKPEWITIFFRRDPPKHFSACSSRRTFCSNLFCYFCEMPHLIRLSPQVPKESFCYLCDCFLLQRTTLTFCWEKKIMNKTSGGF